jgi:hypothetical protein
MECAERNLHRPGGTNPTLSALTDLGGAESIP